MTSLLILFALATTASFAFTPLARRAAFRAGLVDRPDGHRKMHARAVPLGGGLAIFAAVTAALCFAVLFVPGVSEMLARQARTLTGLLLAGSLICLLGIADDFGRLRGRHKLLGQIAAVAILIQSGVIVRQVYFFGWTVQLGLLAVPFTVCWLLGAINSLNLIDGLDGLLSAVGVIIGLGLAAMAVMHGQWAAACVAVALAGALAGFLRYNFPPASIFLGDSGSMLIGLVVGTMAIQAALKAHATLALAAPAALMTIPFLDTAAAIVRRKLTGRSIYTTDRGHLHHCLLRRGYSNLRVLVFVAAVCLLTCAGALASVILRSELLAVVIAGFVIAMLAASRLFGHAECVLVWTRFSAAAASLLRAPNASPRQLEVRLQGNGEWAELWTAIVGCARDLRLVMVRLNVNAPALYEGYHARWDCSHQEMDEQNFWRAEIPLVVEGQNLGRLELCGHRDHEPVSFKITTIARVLEEFELAGLRPAPVTSQLDSHSEVGGIVMGEQVFTG